jgi:hypothetical protein
MPDAEAQTIGQRLGILDRVITMRCIEIESWINKGLDIEPQIRPANPARHSRILAKMEEFQQIKRGYRHFY